MELFDLRGKVVVVTGSTKGIGKAIALRMVEHGARVVVSSRKADACEIIAAEINAEMADKNGGEATPIACNIGHKDQLQKLVDQTVEKWGKIDVMVCNAAVNPYYGSTLDIPDDAFDKILSSNIKSNHWLCNMVIPQMKEIGGGSIIVISSIQALQGSRVIGAYGISKAADLALARNIAAEFGGDNIRANCVAPGLVKTDFAKALWDDPEYMADTLESAALHRIGTPDEIAGAAVFLASRAGDFVTGQTLIADGGVTINAASK